MTREMGLRSSWVRRFFLRVCVVSAFLFAISSVHSEGVVPNSSTTTSITAAQSTSSSAFQLRPPEKKTETKIINGCRHQNTTTYSIYGLSDDSVIDVTEKGMQSCAVSSEIGTVTIRSYRKAPNGTIGDPRWSQVVYGPYATIGDPRWISSENDVPRFVVASTGGGGDANTVYQYISVITGERVVISEPPALFISLLSGKEVRLVGIRSGLNVLQLMKGVVEVSHQEPEEHCKNLEGVVEYGSGNHQLDTVFLIRADSDLDRKIMNSGSRWLFRGEERDTAALTTLISDSVADVRELVAEFKIINMKTGKRSSLQVPITGDRLDIDHAVVPSGLRLSRECK